MPGSLPRLLVGFLSLVSSACAIAVYFPAHRGSRAAQPSGDGTKRFCASEPSGDLLPLSRGERASSPAPLGWRKAAGGFEHDVNRAGRLLCSARAMSLMDSPALHRSYNSFLP